MQRNNGSALSGLKVLDLGQMVAAPLATAIMADMGADVIKIELPLTGDMSRAMLPKQNDISTYFVVFNRGKRGMSLDLKSEKGHEIMCRLIKKADVIVENFRPGVTQRLGLSYEDVSRINPGIIYASISGYGQEGIYAGRAAFDPIAQAMSGIMSVTGPAGGENVRCGTSIADILAGQNAVIGVLAALEHRNKTGEGQHIDIALVDSCIEAMSSVNQIFLTARRVPGNLGNSFESSAPGNSYPTADNSCVVILCGRDAPWRKLTEVLGHAEWADMPEFASVAQRVKNRAALDALVASETIKYNKEDLLKLLLDAKLPAAPMLTVEQVAADPHFRDEREMFVQVDHPELGPVMITGQAIKMSRTNPWVRKCSPLLGQDNDCILSQLGYSAEEIRQFQEEHII